MTITLPVFAERGKYTEEEAREFALSKEVEKYYRESESGKVEVEKSTYTLMGECV